MVSARRCDPREGRRVASLPRDTRPGRVRATLLSHEAESVGEGKRHSVSFPPVFPRDSTPLGTSFVVPKSRPVKRRLLGVNSDLPSRLHLRFALNLPGRSEGEGGRGDPPVEPEPSPFPVFPPTDSAEEP